MLYLDLHIMCITEAHVECSHSCVSAKGYLFIISGSDREAAAKTGVAFVIYHSLQNSILGS